MDNSCLNLKIEESMKDKDIINIMHKASARFSSQLDSDTIYTCQLNALWKAHKNFRSDKNTKFTTYLYKGVFIECLKAVKFEEKHNAYQRKLHDNIAQKLHNNIMDEILDELPSQEDRELIIDKYHNLTIQEMAAKRHYSRETVRKKLKKIYQHLQNQWK